MRPLRCFAAGLSLSVLLVLPAYGNPLNCDPEMTDDQRFQKELCSAHAGCRLVMGIMDTCIAVKGFLGRLGIVGRRDGARLSDGAFESALLESGVPRPNLSNCFTSFDRTLCRQFLGLEKAPDPIQSLTVERELNIKKQGLEMGLTLVRNRAGFWGDAEYGLQGCADARAAGDWTNACARAERLVADCESGRRVWIQRRDELRAEAQRHQIAAIAEWAARNDMPACPSRVPGTTLTPAQAMLQWGQERERAQTQPQPGTTPSKPSVAAGGGAAAGGGSAAAPAQAGDAAAAADPFANLPRRQGGSGLATFQQAAGQAVTPGLTPSSPDVVQSDSSSQQIFSLLGAVAGAGIAGGASGQDRRQAMLGAVQQFGNDGGGAVEAAAIPEIAATGDPDADCKSAVGALRPRFEAGLARAANTVQQIEAFLWLNAHAIAIIDRYCPNTPMGMQERAKLQRDNVDRLRTCNGISTMPCVARLPGESAMAAPAIPSRPSASAGSSTAGSSAGLQKGFPECTPGPTYDSKRCQCRINPRTSGC